MKDDSKYKAVERMLYKYPELKVDINMLRLDLEEAQEVIGIRGRSDNEKAGSSTHAFSSVVENEVLERERNLEKRIDAIYKEIKKNERELERIESVLQLLNEREMMIVEFRYFKGYSINRVCELLEITPTTFNKRRKNIVVKKLMPRLLRDRVHKNDTKSL